MSKIIIIHGVKILVKNKLLSKFSYFDEYINEPQETITLSNNSPTHESFIAMLKFIESNTPIPEKYIVDMAFWGVRIPSEVDRLNNHIEKLEKENIKLNNIIKRLNIDLETEKKKTTEQWIHPLAD